MQTIESYVPITQFKAQLLDIVREMGKTGDTIAITKNGTPEAILMPFSKFDGLLETIDILADTAAMAQIKNSARDAKEGKFVDLDEAFE